MLGDLRAKEEKFAEAEAWYRKAATEYTDTAAREHLWFQARYSQALCLAELGTVLFIRVSFIHFFIFQANTMIAERHSKKSHSFC